jgi:hypothetical protein
VLVDEVLPGMRADAGRRGVAWDAGRCWSTKLAIAMEKGGFDVES